MVRLETEIVQQQQQPQSIPEVAEITPLPALAEPFKPTRPAILFLRRLGGRLADYISDRLPSSQDQRRLSRGRRGSRGLSRRHGSRRCGVCEECRNSRGSFVRDRCRGGMLRQAINY